MNEGRRLQRVIGALIRHTRRRELAQLVINERKQFGGRTTITLFDRVQNQRDVTHSDAQHTVDLGSSLFNRTMGRSSAEERGSGTNLLVEGLPPADCCCRLPQSLLAREPVPAEFGIGLVELVIRLDPLRGGARETHHTVDEDIRID